MYPVAVGTTFVVQQQVTGSGQFTGAEYGRARLTLSNLTSDPNADVRVASKLLGSLSNAITIQFIDRGAGNAQTVTYLEQVGSAIRIYLRRDSSGSPLATAAEVARVINDYARYNTVPISAVAGGTGLGLCTAVAPTALSGGKNFWGYVSGRLWSSVATYAEGDDVMHLGVLYRSLQASNTNHTPAASPSWWSPYERPDGATFRWRPANTNLGFFHFEQLRTVILRQFQAKFTVPAGTHSVRLERVPLNEAFEPIEAEAIPEFVYPSLTTTSTTTSGPDITMGDIALRIPPRWALRVITDVAMPGLVMMDVQREAFV